ncbi:MAG: hypothetical protein AAGI48_00030 [Verrucomicrobiota bacterium]
MANILTGKWVFVGALLLCSLLQGEPLRYNGSYQLFEGIDDLQINYFVDQKIDPLVRSVAVSKDDEEKKLFFFLEGARPESAGLFNGDEFISKIVISDDESLALPDLFLLSIDVRKFDTKDVGDVVIVDGVDSNNGFVQTLRAGEMNVFLTECEAQGYQLILTDDLQKDFDTIALLMPRKGAFGKVVVSGVITESWSLAVDWENL